MSLAATSGWARAAARQRLGVPARRAQARVSTRRRCATTTTTTRSTSYRRLRARGAATLAQRLARRGWRVVVLEKGPFWDPDRDWVSDEAGSHKLYWTDKRIIGGDDPVELGKNNSGHGVGGSMVHFAGYTPRFHPRDFATQTLDGVGADWPISYWDLKPHYELLERELPVAGQDWPWGDPHTYPHGPHPLSCGAGRRGRARCDCGIDMRVGPGGDRQRHVRQPAALHLPRLLPTGVQGERQGVAARHARARRDRARRRDPRRLDGVAHRARRARARARRQLHPRRRRALPAGAAPWPWPATRSRRLACCSTREQLPKGSATTTTRSAAT